MIRTYFLVALRTLRRHPGFTSINVVGLAFSAATVLVLLLFLRSQNGWDTMHDRTHDLYRVTSTFKASFNPGAAEYATSPWQLGAAVAADVPGVEHAASAARSLRGMAMVGDEGIPVSGLFAGPDFLDLFAFPLQEGNRETALEAPFSLVLTPSWAERLLGPGEPVLGASVALDGQTWTVTGVFSQDRYASHIPLSVVASASTIPALDVADRMEAWTSSFFISYTYVRLAEDARPEQVEAAINALRPAQFPETDGHALNALHLQPVRDINMGADLGNQMGPTMARTEAVMLFVIALIILLAACFNYVGLTVSRSLKRAREVGVRKVFGARRTQLVGQFMMEALVVAVGAVVLAVGLFSWMVPAFNTLSFVQRLDAPLVVDFGADVGLFGVLALFVLFITLLAGIYPALFLTRFRPSEAMKGQASLGAGGGVWLRRGLVSIQFAVSVVFLVLGATVYSQTRYIQEADYGFRQDHLLTVDLGDVPFERFAEQVGGSSAVTRVAGTMLLPAMGSRADVFVSSERHPEDIRGYIHMVSDNFTDVLELDLLAGRRLDAARASDSTGAVLVNETLLRVLELGTPDEAIGASFRMWDDDHVIAGVLRDFHADLPIMELHPLVFMLQPQALRWALVDLVPGREEEALAAISAAWTASGGTSELQAHALRAQIADNYVARELRDTMRIAGFAALMAVLIALLGLVGVATFNVERRTREISIRKVLGADVRDVVGLLAREFLVLSAVALTVAIPVSLALGNAFLADYTMRIDLGPGLIAASVAVILVLSLGAVGTQTIRAALTDPVNHLRGD